MSSNIDGFLAQKYRAMGQEADARTLSAETEAKVAPIKANAEAGLAGAQAGHLQAQTSVIPMQAQAQAGLQGAQAGYYGSHADLNRFQMQPMSADMTAALRAIHMAQAPYNDRGQLPNYQAAPAAAPAGRSILDNGAKGGNTGDAYGGTASLAPAAPVSATPAPNAGSAAAAAAHNAPYGSYMDLTKPGGHAAAPFDTVKPTSGPMQNSPVMGVNVTGGYSPERRYAEGTGDVQNYANGTGQVPGQGSGAVDTVPAMLAPHEAVLNRGANEIANHMHPGLVEALNAMGAHKMALEGHPPQPGPQDAPQAAPGRGMPAPKAKHAGKGAPPSKGPIKAAAGNANVQKGKQQKQAIPPYQADDPLGWQDPVTSKTMATAAGYAQGTSFVAGFGAPSNPQSSNSDYAAALKAQDPNSVANTVSDVRSKLTGGRTTVPRVVPGG